MPSLKKKHPIKDEKQSTIKVQSSLDQLRQILLEEDRKSVIKKNQDLLERINLFEQELKDPDKFIKLVENSKDHVIDLLSPYFGKLLKKFIQVEIEKVFASIEQSRKRFFTISGIKNLLFKKAGVKINETQIVPEDPLDQLIIVQKESGLLLGNHSVKNSEIDLDIISGMITAIKDFSESAFDQKNQDLDSISYSGYNLLLHSYEKFFIVAVIDGPMSPDFKSRMYDDFLLLGELINPLINNENEVTNELNQNISILIKNHFSNEHNK